MSAPMITVWTPEDFVALATEAAAHRAEAIDLRVELDWTNGTQR